MGYRQRKHTSDTTIINSMSIRSRRRREEKE
jgi:hypothetical protein